MNCLNNKLTKSKLIFRGSRDGFTGEAFHRLCDNSPNTISIIKSTEGKIFGGFASFKWINAK